MTAAPDKLPDEVDVQRVARAMCDRVNGQGDYDANPARHSGWNAQARTAIAAWNTRPQPACSTPAGEGSGVGGASLVGAAAALAWAEKDYRQTHDLYGDGARETGRAWDLMRRAGDTLRAALARSDASERGGK